MSAESGVDLSPAKHSSADGGSDNERLRAIGTFICGDGQRLRAAAALCRSDTQGSVESEVSGVSMGSVIPHGSHIRIGFGADPSELGSVIAFISAGKVMVHRVRWRGRLRRARGFLITQGDAMLLPDVPVESETVLGEVVAVEAGAGWSPPRAKPHAPRRERALSFLVFAASVVLLEIEPRLARWVLRMLGAAERRYSWTRALLY